jgi:hypothetical protein
MPRIKASDIANLKLEFPKESYGNAEDELKEFEINVGPKKKKSTTKKDIKKLIKEVKNTKTKKIDTSKIKHINDILNLVSDINKAPKMKKMDTESIQHQINEVEKLLKSKPKALKKLVNADKEHIKYHPSKMDKEELKLDTKIMKQAKDYTHKVKNVSHAVKNYVDQYIDIYKNSKNAQSRSKKLNDLKLKVYTNLKPSDIDDANTLIGEFKKTLDPIVKSNAKPKQTSSEDKKYKSVSAYVKKNKPSITNEEDIHLITTYLIDKNQRMSKKLLDEILKDLEY